MTTNTTEPTRKTVSSTLRLMEDDGQIITWTEYECGAALAISDTNAPNSTPDLLLHGIAQRGPITLSYLTDLADDLRCLANDPQVRAMLSPGAPPCTQSPVGLGCPICRGDLALNLHTLFYHCEQAGCGWAGLRPDLVAPGDPMQLVVATIDDAPVLAERYILDPRADPDCPPQGLLGGFTLTWKGETISVSGDEAINMPDAGTGISDDLHERHFPWLKAAMAADVFPRLMAIARRYYDQPWPLSALGHVA